MPSLRRGLIEVRDWVRTIGNFDYGSRPPANFPHQEAAAVVEEIA